MKIKEISKMTELSFDTIRYYEKLGLIKPKKNQYYKEYFAEDLEKLKFIAMLKACQFTLNEIKRVFYLNEKWEDLMQMSSSDRQILTQIYPLFLKKYQQVLKLEEVLKEAKITLSKSLEKVKGALSE